MPARRCAVTVVVLLAGGALPLTGCGEADGGDTGAQASSVRDCGTVVSTSDALPLPCFDAAFATCSPASVLVDNRGPVLSGVKVRYRITGRTGADCHVTWSYIALPPNPTWEGKDIDCPYTPGPSFLAALNARGTMTGCRGPLMAVITG